MSCVILSIYKDTEIQQQQQQQQQQKNNYNSNKVNAVYRTASKMKHERVKQYKHMLSQEKKKTLAVSPGC